MRGAVLSIQTTMYDLSEKNARTILSNVIRNRNSAFCMSLVLTSIRATQQNSLNKLRKETVEWPSELALRIPEHMCIKDVGILQIICPIKRIW